MEKTVTTPEERWAEVANVEREIRLMAYAAAGDPKEMDHVKMLSFWSGRLQKAINND